MHFISTISKTLQLEEGGYYSDKSLELCLDIGGTLTQGHLVEVDCSGLVAGYVGQTALKTQEVVQSAPGGVLFIDEAYSLASGRFEQDYGKEAIETILKSIEDNRDNLIVIVAGYPELMNGFLKSNRTTLKI